MRFLVDAQLPTALARLLTAHGHRAEHVFDIGMEGATDHNIWRRAAADQAVLMTKDEDFIQLGRTGGGQQIVWFRTGNTTRKALIAGVPLILPQIVAAIEAGERVVEVRSLPTS